MTRISQVIIQGSITNPDNYKVTSGNRWLDRFDNLKIVHGDFRNKQVSFVIDWKNGRINHWCHDFELATDWMLEKVTIIYTDRRGNVVLRTTPETFRFRYNISREGVIKNWKEHKKGFTSIMKWSLDNSP